MCRSYKEVIFVWKMVMPFNKRFTNRVTRSVLEIRSPRFYARPSQAQAVRKRSGFVFPSRPSNPVSKSLAHESKKELSEVEKLFSKFCKHLSGVHKYTTNIAIHGELGTYPLHIEINIKMVLYFLYLRDQDNKVLSGTLTELQKINSGRASSWIKKIEQLIAEYNLDITTYKYRSKNENFHHQLL